ncbi:hypothetical protein UlMin_026114 [Ulmus minor]
MCFEQKEVGQRVVDKRQGLGTPGEEEPRINVNHVVSNGHRVIQVSDGSLVLQSLPQGSVVCWDRFLPIKSLKVFLVKNDDSTRHVVSALLRNCSYEVNLANGLQAWKILEDPNNHIDLVLKEVVMPILSGIGLLCKIMRHKSLKNIPIITIHTVMSSHDSMGIVFKCLSKGAVDFLVKPIWKSELKNLWQHVWRRCHSNDESENNSSSSNEQDNGSIGLSIWDGSDNGSGTQDSRAAEVHSPGPISSGDQLTDAPDSTCAQVIHTKPEKCSSRWDNYVLNCLIENAAIGKDLEIGGTINQDLQCVHQQTKFPFALTSQRHYKLPEIDSQPFEGKLDHNGENIIKGNYDFGGHPSLELTLKRLRGARGVGEATQDYCNFPAKIICFLMCEHIKIQSDILFFPLLCRYNTPSSANQGCICLSIMPELPTRDSSMICF